LPLPGYGPSGVVFGRGGAFGAASEKLCGVLKQGVACLGDLGVRRGQLTQVAVDLLEIVGKHRVSVRAELGDSEREDLRWIEDAIVHQSVPFVGNGTVCSATGADLDDLDHDHDGRR